MRGGAVDIVEVGMPVGAFDYGALPTGEAKKLQAAAARIRAKVAHTYEAIVEVGRELLEVKAKLGHGRFTAWRATECDLSPSTAARFMRVARLAKSVTVTNLTPGAAYELATKSTPATIYKAIVDRTQRGETIARADVLALKGTAQRRTSEPRAGCIEGQVEDDPLSDVHRLVRQLAERIRPLKEKGVAFGSLSTDDLLEILPPLLRALPKPVLRQLLDPYVPIRNEDQAAAPSPNLRNAAKPEAPASTPTPRAVPVCTQAKADKWPEVPRCFDRRPGSLTSGSRQ